MEHYILPPWVAAPGLEVEIVHGSVQTVPILGRLLNMVPTSSP